MSRKSKTGYYCLKIDAVNNYWTLQKNNIRLLLL